MKINKGLKIIALLLTALALYSLAPLAPFYLMKDPPPYSNSMAISQLENNKGEHFEFIVLGDNHAGLILDDSAALKLVRNINREGRFNKAPIDFVEITGDITFRGSAWDYRMFNRVRSLINMPVISAMGNHDNDKDDGELFKKYAGADEFSFTDRNSYFIFIDNGPNDLSEKQFSYLEDQLNKSAAYSHRFVFLHKSPTSYQQTWYRPELSPWSYRFMKLCEKYKVDIVFSGHEHMFKKRSFGGVQYVTSGGGGIITHIPRQDGGFLHYIVVRVNGDYVDYEVRKVSPPFWEFLAYYMWKDIFYFLKGVFV